MKGRYILGGIAVVGSIIGGSLAWLSHYKDTLAKNGIVLKFFNEAPIAKSPEDTSEHWFDNAKNFRKSYTYPAQEFEVFVDFINPEIPPVPQKLLITAINPYYLACLNEVLKAQNIHFAYSKNHNSTDIIIYLPKEHKKATNLIQELRYYEIPFTYQ